MTNLGKINCGSPGGRSFTPRVYSTHIENFESLGNFRFPTAHTVLFLATDTTGAEVDPIYRAAEYVLGSGVVYVNTWGGDCERLHDIFDEAYVGDGSLKRDLDCTTTWHSDQTLEEAVFFFLNCARPAEIEDLESVAYIAVTIADEALSNRVIEAILASDNFLT